MDPAALERRLARRHHAIYLAIALAALVAPALLSVDAGGEAVSLGGWRLPPLCTFKAITGVGCPGCGMTRAFVLLAHGMWADAFAMHRVAIPLWAFAVYQLWYRPWMIARGALEPPPALGRAHARAAWALVAGLFVSWVAGLALGRVAP